MPPYGGQTMLYLTLWIEKDKEGLGPGGSSYGFVPIGLLENMVMRIAGTQLGTNI